MRVIAEVLPAFARFIQFSNHQARSSSTREAERNIQIQKGQNGQIEQVQRHMRDHRPAQTAGPAMNDGPCRAHTPGMLPLKRAVIWLIAITARGDNRMRRCRSMVI